MKNGEKGRKTEKKAWRGMKKTEGKAPSLNYGGQVRIREAAEAEFGKYLVKKMGFLIVKKKLIFMSVLTKIYVKRLEKKRKKAILRKFF